MNSSALKVVSWNLNGLSEEQRDPRTEAALTEILLGIPMKKLLAGASPKTPPDVVMLQEVVARTYHAHLRPHLRAAGFSIFPEEPPQRSYFEVIAVRDRPILEAHSRPFADSALGRYLTTVRIEQLTLMTAHLESLKSGSADRISQASHILWRLGSTPRSLFLGDTNLRESEWSALHSDGITDAWVAAGSDPSQKSTWGHRGAACRFDRAWSHGLRVRSFGLLGTTFVEGLGQPPSDHRGICVQVA